MAAVSYLFSVTCPKQRRKTLRGVTKDIRESGLDFDTIACRGVSGVLIAPVVADRLGKQCAVVRKSRDNNHSGALVESHALARRYIIIDDVIDSGETVNSIVRAMESHHKERSQWDGRVRDELPACVGIFLYRSGRGTGGEYPLPGQQKSVPLHAKDYRDA